MSWLSDFLSPPASNIPLPQQTPFTPNYPNVGAYNPTGFGQAEQGVLGGIGGLGAFNMYGANLGQAQGITQGLINNPYGGDWLSGAQTASGMGQQGAINQFGAGGGLYGLGGAIANTAFDPQGALYGRTLQQIQDQARASQGVRGIQTSPYGAGLENQATENFNIDWQNQQLQRQIAGGQAAGGLFTQGAGLQAGAPGQFYQASGLPYQTYQGIGQNQLGALGQLGQFGAAAGQQAQQPINQYMQYLGWASPQQQQMFNQQQTAGFQDPLQTAQFGWGQQTDAFNAALAREKQASQESQQMWSGIGKLGSIAAAPFTGGASLAFLPAFGGGGGGTGGGGIGNPFGGWQGSPMQSWMSGWGGGGGGGSNFASAYGTPGQLFPGYGTG